MWRIEVCVTPNSSAVSASNVLCALLSLRLRKISSACSIVSAFRSPLVIPARQDS
jgi:hypothetical protein